MFQVKKSVEEIRIKDAVAILQTLPEWWKRRISGKAKDYAVEPAVMERLIEQFTSEMTLVAEGLCEDQSKLRKEVDGMITEEEVAEMLSAQ